MVKKIMISLLLLLFVSSVVHGMEHAVESGSDDNNKIPMIVMNEKPHDRNANIGESKSTPNLISLRNSQGNDDNKMPTTALFNEDMQGPGPNAGLSQSMPNLNLSRFQTKSSPNLAPSLRNSPKTPIKKMDQFGDVRREKKLQKTSQADRSSRGSDTPPPHIIVDIDKEDVDKKRSVLPKALINSSLMNSGIGQEKYYSTDEVWDILSKTSPALYKFGISHSMSLDDVMFYSKLLQDFQVEPQALIEFVKTYNKIDDKKAADWQLKKYEGIQKKDPERYAALVLDVLKAVCDEGDGQQIQSPLNNTHIGLLENQVVGQEGTIRSQYIAIIIKLVLLAGTTAWGIYGQYASSTCGSRGGGNSTG